MPNKPIVFGGVTYTEGWVPDFGAAFFAPQFGKVLSNPIGAGINVGYRPQPTYGGGAQYFNDAIWWTSQIVPTSISLQGLTDPQELQALLGNVLVEAVYPTTG